MSNARSTGAETDRHGVFETFLVIYEAAHVIALAFLIGQWGRKRASETGFIVLAGGLCQF